MNDVTTIRTLDPVTQPISPAKFAHFVLRTGQIDTMAKWYQTVLAARVVFRDQMLCFLSYDDEHHRLALINIPGLPVRDPDAVGTDHVAYSYNNLGELLSTYRRLKAAGIAPHWPINHGVTTSMYYRDPDNNRVELQIDNFATPAELDGYFHSRAFAENPVGVTYDPEELCRRYEAGEAMADLLRIRPLPEDSLGYAGEPLTACAAIVVPLHCDPEHSRLSANSLKRRTLTSPYNERPAWLDNASRAQRRGRRRLWLACRYRRGGGVGADRGAVDDPRLIVTRFRNTPMLGIKFKNEAICASTNGIG